MVCCFKLNISISVPEGNPLPRFVAHESKENISSHFISVLLTQAKTKYYRKRTFENFRFFVLTHIG